MKSRVCYLVLLSLLLQYCIAEQLLSSTCDESCDQDCYCYCYHEKSNYIAHHCIITNNRTNSSTSPNGKPKYFTKKTIDCEALCCQNKYRKTIASCGEGIYRLEYFFVLVYLLLFTVFSCLIWRIRICYLMEMEEEEPADADCIKKLCSLIVKCICYLTVGLVSKIFCFFACGRNLYACLTRFNFPMIGFADRSFEFTEPQSEQVNDREEVYHISRHSRSERVVSLNNLPNKSSLQNVFYFKKPQSLTIQTDSKIQVPPSASSRYNQTELNSDMSRMKTSPDRRGTYREAGPEPGLQFHTAGILPPRADTRAGNSEKDGRSYRRPSEE